MIHLNFTTGRQSDTEIESYVGQLVYFAAAIARVKVKLT